METIQLDPNELAAESERATTLGGIPIRVSASAFDVPRSIMVERDVVRHLLKIVFQYIDQEPSVESTVGPDLVVRLGQNSKKVLAFEMKGTPERARDITFRVVDGVEAQLKNATKDNQRLNYRMIRSVIQNKLEALLAK
jgi:hypothetical protein